ncbi:ejaculatory bulb-specific protein 3-like [Bombyx mandarina]|nr:chemosensory protein precursor [Bombyx mori]XP_028028731.1 ejaculatory bulb-specific protein 3-like [Bombyx mandarina]BAF34357.1 chemosensory protein9 [Bombyx mori]CAJ01455.1 hypothetical protein [Bombyx mori]
MKFVLALIALAVVVAARPNDDLFYDKKYDNFNVDEIIDNPRLLKAYTFCFNDKGKCTAEGNDFKKWIPESLQTSCGKCSEKQKYLVAKFVHAIKDKMPDEFDILRKLHDPKGEYTENLDKFLETYGH